MSEKPVRFGILGCASIARKISRAINRAPNASIQAIGSRSIDKASRFASENGFPASAAVYGSYEAVLDDPDVDAVYVPLPTSLHVKWAVLAAEKKKHILLEKPVALNVSELDVILQACESNGVQYMDATMWMHHPRTAQMREFLSDPQRFGQLKSVHSIFCYNPGPDFLINDIRIKPDLDGLGCLGDAGWYCIRAILWAADYQLPERVTALPNPEFNESGVILSCGASLSWTDGKIATFYCSFLTNLTMDLTCAGTNGYLHVHDFVIPFQEKVASFYGASNSRWVNFGCEPTPTKHKVATDLPHEAIMVREFARLVASIEGNGLEPEKKWPIISRKTQLVVDAVKASIDRAFEPVEVGNY
ncbi:hypothetical protein Vadar_007548 [Vaccinium darrowii]|uniref:Uncharacterized protein n=1 Tax=Vaccinium darrowii TaxID=229202 RepID=A0ACB7XNZ2_9ERIC|nr:hypothetical protein Vadar_007548 [Vaccinium darrowii]